MIKIPTFVKNNPPFYFFERYFFSSFFIISLVFFGLLYKINLFAQALREKYIFDVPPIWPISVFEFESLDLWKIYLGIIGVFIIIIIIIYKKFILQSFWRILLVSLVLIFFTNILHGWDRGIVYPLTGGSNQYYEDAIGINASKLSVLGINVSLAAFLYDFEKIQPGLGAHAQTHPPLAVVIFYILDSIVHNPATVSLILSIASTILSAYFLYHILYEEFSQYTAALVTFLYFLIPAVQIYYMTTMEAFLTGLLLGCFYFFRKQGIKNIAMSSFLLLMSLLFSFGSIFIIPVLAAYDFFSRRSIKQFLKVINIVVLSLFAMNILINYDYVESYRVASAIESQEAKLFVEPISYLFTRAEDIAEILLFFGPALILLFIMSLHKSFFKNKLFVTGIMAIISLLVIFITGAFRTGETARAAMFIYPYLLFPIACSINKKSLRPIHENFILLVTFIQVVAMQIVGFYFW